MADPFTQALYDRLVDIIPLKPGEQRPHVYTYPAPVPPEGENPDSRMLWVVPCIVVSGPALNIPEDTKTTRGRIHERHIVCYTEDHGSTADVDAIAEEVRRRLHITGADLLDPNGNRPLTVAGYEVIIQTVHGPVVAPTDTRRYGRALVVTMHAQETA